MIGLLLFSFFGGNELRFHPNRNQLELHAGGRVHILGAPGFVTVNWSTPDDTHFELDRMGIGFVSVMQGRIALVGIRSGDLKVIRPDGSMDTVAPFPKDPRQLVASDLFIGTDRGMVVKSEGRIYVIEGNAKVHRLNPALTLSVPRIVAALTDATPHTIDRVIEREEARFLLSKIYDGLETWGHAASDLEKSQLDRSIARGTLMQLTTLNSRMRKVLNAFQKRKESWPDSVSPVGLLLKVFASCDLHLRGDTGA